MIRNVSVTENSSRHYRSPLGRPRYWPDSHALKCRGNREATEFPEKLPAIPSHPIRHVAPGSAGYGDIAGRNGMTIPLRFNTSCPIHSFHKADHAQPFTHDDLARRSNFPPDTPGYRGPGTRER